jgi:twinkle protein
MLTKRTVELLEARGLDLEVLERLGVESSTRGPDWIEIPYLVRGKRVNCKYRTIAGPKAFSQEKDAVKCFWNFDVLSDSTLKDQPLIITEGEFDAAIAIQCGYPRTVSVPDGAPPAKIGSDDLSRKYGYLEHAREVLRDVKPIIIAADADAAGANLLEDLSLRLGRHRCKWLRYPHGCKDLNDVFCRFDHRGVVETINGASWCKVDGVYRMSELPPRTAAPVYRIGLHGLSEHYGIRPGDFVVITGIPGHGKTTLLNEIMGRMAREHAWTIAVASFEQLPQTDHKRALRRWFNKKPVNEQTADEIVRADQWIENHFVFVVPSEDEDATLEWLVERAAVAVTQLGANMVVVDPWNEMDHTRPRDMTLTEYTGFAIKALRKFAQKHRTHVIVSAHPTKLQRGKDGKLPCPTLYDVSDSAHWANKPDIGIVVHREGSETTVRVQKARYPEETGECGDVKLHYVRHMGRFECALS